MVWTPDGPKPIETIKPGDIIYTYNEKTGLLETTTVVKVFNNGVAESVEIRTKTGHRAQCTPDHEYLTTDGWVEAADLTQNNTLIEINDPIRYIDASESEAILLGYLLTDGYLGDDKNQVHFTNTCYRYLMEYQKHFEIKFGEKIRFAKHDWDNPNGKNKSGKQNHTKVRFFMEQQIYSSVVE
jgi:intein/homing endonuclease